ncbi:MAG: hypothetical protein K6E33_03435 [Lachnospiraceae bacterium]|nr:hypothetical protein [Lachnospiraceae bacterium]
MGSYRTDEGIRFSACFPDLTKECGVVVYFGGQTRGKRIAFPPECRYGDIYCALVSGLPENTGYRYYCGDEEFADRYAARGDCNGHFGDKGRYRSLIAYPVLGSEHCGTGDHRPHIPYCDTIFYVVNVRAYTMHRSSHAREKGTFDGVREKIPYMKELGVTSVILMPAYDFNEDIGESDRIRAASSMEYAARSYKNPDSETVKCNIWGYTDEARYKMPNPAFSRRDPVKSFKDLVSALHDEGMELIMQMYFTDDLTDCQKMHILDFWMAAYGVDGFELIGPSVNSREIVRDPMLSDVKLIFSGWQTDDYVRSLPNVCITDEMPMVTMRRFLKGDSDQVSGMISLLKNVPAPCARTVYVARERGMRLSDVVTYNEKHNAENGEDGRDGDATDHSWNCGTEGPTRKKGISALRLRQEKNLATMMLLSQGTPVIYGGDEFLSTQNGNNNPYCQDNDTFYVKWNETKAAQDFHQWIKALIDLRKAHRSLHMDRAFRLTDYLSYGCPDISFHGQDVWRARTDPVSHSFAVLYALKYGDGTDEGYIYAGFNMHWEKHVFSLPTIPGGGVWELYMNSGNARLSEDGLSVTAEQRSVFILKSGAL